MAVRPFDPAGEHFALQPVLGRLFETRFGTWMAINVGRKTGARRTTPLLYFTAGDRVVLIASNGGAPSHPAWFHNLKANPEVEASTDGRAEPYVAREAEGDERERLWKLATMLYAGYQDYQRRAGNRRIPVIVLERSGRTAPHP